MIILVWRCTMYIRGFTKFGIKILWRLQFLEYLRTLRLKFQFSWDSQQGRLRTTSILVRAFWNFKLKVLKYSKNCSLHNTLIPNLVKPLMYLHNSYNGFTKIFLCLNVSWFCCKLLRCVKILCLKIFTRSGKWLQMGAPLSLKLVESSK